MTLTMISFQQDKVLNCTEWIVMERFPASGIQTGWSSPIVNALAVGPLDLQAGDILDVRLQHELDNENTGHPAYFIHSQRHEWGWAMGSTAVRIGPTINPNSGPFVIQPQEQNWDILVHHLGINRSSYYIVPNDMPGVYIYDRIYFKGGIYIGAYAPAVPPAPEQRRCQINASVYPLLQVAQFREI